MRLNAVEFALMNNPLRAAVQRYLEAPRLLAMGGSMSGGRALEIGCGRGVGVELILARFCADRVDAFDFDPRMVERAVRRLADHDDRVRLWVGDASAIAAPDDSYDAVFDFGIVHHVAHWRSVVSEVRRVLKPGGRFYAEEILAPFIHRTRHILRHPQSDRFDAVQFCSALADEGLEPVARRESGCSIVWVVAEKKV